MKELCEKWKAHILAECAKPYMIDLRNFVNEERKDINKMIYPRPNEVFASLELTPFDKVKVVLIGNTPYFNTGCYNGLAFSCANSFQPPELRELFNKIYVDYHKGFTGGIQPFKTNDLSQWAHQGCLLLNSVLTTEKNYPGSHAGKGWETFTDSVLNLLFNGKEPIVFIAPEGHWIHGRKGKLGNHLILNYDKDDHIFTQTNAFIRKNYYQYHIGIKWSTWLDYKFD